MECDVRIGPEAMYAYSQIYGCWEEIGAVSGEFAVLYRERRDFLSVKCIDAAGAISLAGGGATLRIAFGCGVIALAGGD